MEGVLIDGGVSGRATSAKKESLDLRAPEIGMHISVI